MQTIQALALGPSWMNPENMLNSLGQAALWGAAAVIFAECGLLIGFFLPGDSLLFTVAMLVTTGVIKQPLWLACAVLFLAAFAGNVCGYEIGNRVGPAIFAKQNSKIFKKEYVDKTHEFFTKYGNRAIVLGRFVPVVRTFITVMAGVGKMERRRFFTYSALGALLWAVGVTLLGAALGKVPFVRDNIEVMLLAIVAISVIPVAIEVLRERRKSARAV